MLLLYVLLPVLVITEHIKDTNYTIRKIDSCPDVGYFFKRDMPPNEIEQGHCYLCFCQVDGTAACWRRENRRCDLESYHFHGIGKRNTRGRRSVNLGDIFFRDATRDAFSKRLPEQCKPNESSFSDGCPPADWCIGCTVCDCDAHGHWDCRVLSYCPEVSTQKSNKRRGSYRNNNIIRKTSSNVPGPMKPKPKKPTPKKPIRNLQRPNKVTHPVKKVVRQNLATPKPVTISGESPQITIPNTAEFAQRVIKRVMAAMQQYIRNDVKKGNSSLILKAVHSPESNEVVRHKRDVGSIEIRKTNETTAMENTTQIEILVETSNQTTVKEVRTTLTDSPYYTYYLLNNNTLNDSIVNNNETESISTTTPVNYNKLRNSNQSLESIDNILRNANDLKYKDWPQIKRLKTNKKLFKLDLIKFENFLTTLNKTKQNSSDVLVSRRKVTKQVIMKDRERKNIVKTVVTATKNKRREAKLDSNTAIANIRKLQNKFKNILHDIISSSTTKPTLLKFKFINKIKRMLNKIISRKTKIPNKKLKTLDIICQEFGPCFLNQSQKRLVNLKLIQLNAEIRTILRTIEIIKGLLKLINIPNKITDPSNKLNDLQKLDSIINGDLVDVAEYNLTQTELTQVDYIKTNTQMFVKSVGKFAKTLQDIIAVLNKNKQDTIKLTYNHKKNTPRKVFKNRKNKSLIDMFKDLLKNYNIMHNSFMKNLYKILNKIENEPKTQRKPIQNKVVTQNGVKNLSMILKKLTGIEEKTRLRSKRDVGRDDAVEYLLMVMEFLLKQNYHLDTVPVDDGIDLLLDAIKNAPDIKTTKKKVLEDVTFHGDLAKVPDNDLPKSDTNSKPEIDDIKPNVTANDGPEIGEDTDRDYDDSYVNRRLQNTTSDNDVPVTEISMTQSTDNIRSSTYPTKLPKIDKEANNIDDEKYDVYIADSDRNDRFNESMEMSTQENKDTNLTLISELDWFGKNDNAMREINEEKNNIDNHISTTSEKNSLTTEMPVTKKVVENNISGISKEQKDELTKTKSIEQIMIKKQMDLLNSLDYETEKIFTDSSESNDEKYPETNSD